MKTFRRVLGGILMIPSAVALAAFLWNLIVRFDPEVDTAFNILMLAVYAGIFFLGYRIFGFKKKTLEPDRAAAPEQKPAGKREPPRAVSAPAAVWVPEEDSVRLYSDSSARFSKKPALSSLVLRCDQGTPVMICATAWDDGRGGDTDGKRAELPPELLSDLNVQALISWLQDQLEGLAGDVDWTAVAGAPGLAGWIAGVRHAQSLDLPPSLYPVSNPFEKELEHVGPDGLRERSTERLWVGKKNDTDMTRALTALLTWQEEHRPKFGTREAWLLIRSNRPADGAVSSDLAARCAAAGVKLAARRGDELHEFLSGTDWRLYTAEYPGQADDAATYGEWDLVPASKPPRPRDVPDEENWMPPAPAEGPGTVEEEDRGTLDDVTFIRAMRSSMSGPWHQYDVLFAARPYGWAAAVDWAAYMAGADISHIGTVTAGDLGGSSREMIDAYRDSGEDLKKMKELEFEQGYLSIGGSSRALSDLVKIVWINQTATMRLFTMRDQDRHIRAYVETVARRTFGTPDEMKVGRPIPEKKG